MFKILKTTASLNYLPGSLPFETAEPDALAQYCVSEPWTGDMGNGLFHLGERTASLHGLARSECGLLNLVKCYEATDRTNVLEIFEQAATSCSSFCFSTTIMTIGGPKQPVFCIGESTGVEQKYSGKITGVFLFPNFQLPSPFPPMSRQ